MSTEDFKRVVESLRTAVAIADAKGVVAFANPAFVQLAGDPDHGVSGHSLAAALPPRRRQAHPAERRAHRRGQDRLRAHRRARGRRRRLGAARAAAGDGFAGEARGHRGRAARHRRAARDGERAEPHHRAADGAGRSLAQRGAHRERLGRGGAGERGVLPPARPRERPRSRCWVCPPSRSSGDRRPSTARRFRTPTGSRTPPRASPCSGPTARPPGSSASRSSSTTSPRARCGPRTPPPAGAPPRAIAAPPRSRSSRRSARSCRSRSRGSRRSRSARSRWTSIPALVEHFHRIRASTETALVAIGDLVDFSKVEGGIELHRAEFRLRAAVADLVKRVGSPRRGMRLPAAREGGAGRAGPPRGRHRAAAAAAAQPPRERLRGLPRLRRHARHLAGVHDGIRASSSLSP